MNNNNELLEYIFQTCEMGKNNLEILLKDLNDKDNKIKNDIEKDLKKYEEYYNKSKKILKENKIKPQSKGIVNDMMSKMSIDMTVMKDNSDAKIAEMILQGLNMGIIEMEKKINDYKDDIDKDVIKLAKDVKKFQEESINTFKEYL